MTSMSREPTYTLVGFCLLAMGTQPVGDQPEPLKAVCGVYNSRLFASVVEKALLLK